MKEKKLNKFTLKAGTLIKLSGFPFYLESDTVILGTKNNFKMANEPKKERTASDFSL